MKLRAPNVQAGRIARLLLWKQSKTFLAAVASGGLLALACVWALAPTSQARTGAHVAAGRGCTDARLVSYTPRPTTVGALRALPRRGARTGSGRRRGTETRTYTLKAELVAMRAMSGGEVELVVAQPGKPARTMIVVFPGRGCKGRKGKRRDPGKARSALVSACGMPARDATPLAGAAAITGVGFYARGSNKNGAAPNGIELSVLEFRSTGCRRRAVAPAEPFTGPPASASAFPQVPAAPPPPPVEPPPIYPGLPPPDPADRPCTEHLATGSVESFANLQPNQVVCLQTGYYMEYKDALILLSTPGVRVQPEPNQLPIVCGHIVPRASGTSVSTGVHEDPTCIPYFNEDSPYNKIAKDVATGPSVPIPDTWLADFDASGTGSLQLSRAWTHGKAIFKASPSDPVTAKFRIADSSQCQNDPHGCGGWQPDDPAHAVTDDSSPDSDLIPIPAGVACPGLPNIDDQHDRALVVISADGKTAWEFWHCTHVATPSEPWYTAAVAAKWPLDPNNPSPANRGYQDQGLTATGSGSARASGTPLVTTTITPREAFFGIHHPIGLTVNKIETGYVSPPASHTDDCSGCSHLRYGMLFVLNPSFPIPEDATFGQINLIQALKKYGAYIVDRGPLFEIDGSPNEPSDPSTSEQLWADAGLDQNLNGLVIKPSDLLYVPTPGSPPPLP